jgi:3-hydroxybutyryl-CoA dehydratase
VRQDFPLTPEAGLPPVERQISQEKILQYAHVSGDLNPLHIDPEFASRTPFGGVVAHGLLTLAYLSESLTQAFGKAWPAGGRLRVRFRAPARPGDTVTAGGQITAVEGGVVRCAVEVRNQQGEVLISGEAEIPIS